MAVQRGFETKNPVGEKMEHKSTWQICHTAARKLSTSVILFPAGLLEMCLLC